MIKLKHIRRFNYRQHILCYVKLIFAGHEEIFNPRFLKWPILFKNFIERRLDMIDALIQIFKSKDLENASLLAGLFVRRHFYQRKKCRVFSYWISFCINMQPACMKKRLVEFSTALNWSRSLIIFHNIIHLKLEVWKAFYWISIIWFKIEIMFTRLCSNILCKKLFCIKIGLKYSSNKIRKT